MPAVRRRSQAKLVPERGHGSMLDLQALRHAIPTAEVIVMRMGDNQMFNCSIQTQIAQQPLQFTRARCVDDDNRSLRRNDNRRIGLANAQHIDVQVAIMCRAHLRPRLPCAAAS